MAFESGARLSPDLKTAGGKGMKDTEMMRRKKDCYVAVILNLARLWLPLEVRGPDRKAGARQSFAPSISDSLQLSPYAVALHIEDDIIFSLVE